MTSTDHPTRYPLAWPAGVPRTPAQKRESAGRFRTTFSKAITELLAELRRLGVAEHSVIVSTNIPTRIDGLPYANRKSTAADPGVAVYWRSRDGKPMAMATDRYDTELGNIRGITLTLEAFRAIERHGSSDMLDRAFQGFVAIPEHSGPAKWWTVLGFEFPPPSWYEVHAAHRELIAKLHPDKPGSGDAGRAAEINVARDEARHHYFGSEGRR